MASTLKTDVRYQDPFVQSGFSETITQNIDAFNAASRGAIQLRSERKRGDFDYRAFVQNAGGLVSRQDLTSIGTVPSTALTQDTDISVKLSRRVGPVSWTLNSIRKSGMDMDALRVAAGEQWATDAQAEQLNSGVAAAAAALKAQAAVYEDGGIAATITTSGLVDGLARFGDAAGRLVTWVMHSKVYFDLVKDQIADALTNIADFNIREGAPVTLNRPVVVTDSPSLIVPDGGGVGIDTFLTLGLASGGVVTEETEEEVFSTDQPLEQEQLRFVVQGEFAYNLGLRGFKWDTTAGDNPLAAALATGANWDPTRVSHKDFAGVAIETL